MHVQLLSVPYDSGVRGVRMGAGPARLLAAGLESRLRAAGHQVALAEITPPPAAVPAEIHTALAVNADLARRVRTAVSEGALPLILSGSCYAAVGAVAGLSPRQPGVLWFDSHGDLHTPETTASGFLDGMALAMLTGRCWHTLLEQVPGFEPVPEQQVLLLGARDLDPPERAYLEDAATRHLPPARFRTEFSKVMRSLRTTCSHAYLHIDLDVLDPADGRANALAAPDGLRLPELLDACAQISRVFHLGAVALTAYDPAVDVDGRACEAALQLLHTLCGGSSDVTSGPPPG